MGTPATGQIISRSDAQTRCLGRCLGLLAPSGLVIRLTGELGSGKTCFVQGLARGLGVPERYDITSPTYTLIHQYPARLPFAHVDLYRLGSSAEADGIGLWEIFKPEAVVAVEWSDRLGETDWPAANLRVSFDIQMDDSRIITLIGCGLQIADLIKQAVADYNGQCSNKLK